MKKFLLICVAAMVALSSCSKPNDEQTKDKNPYTGTKWSRVISKTMQVLEFTSDTEAMVYEADENGNFKSTTAKGKYTYSGNTITFSNMVDVGAVDYIYEKAEVSGSTLQLFYYWEKDGNVKILHHFHVLYAFV